MNQVYLLSCIFLLIVAITFNIKSQTTNSGTISGYVRDAESGEELIGATIYALALLTTWILTYRVVLQGNEKKIWRAFEMYERTGTRIMVIFFQIMLFIEAFY